MNTKKLKKVAICLIVLLMVMAGTLAWLTTSDTKKGRIKAGELEALVEKVYYDETAKEWKVHEDDENPFQFVQTGLMPISKTNPNLDEKVEDQFVRVTNKSTTPLLVTVGIRNIGVLPGDADATTEPTMLVDENGDIKTVANDEIFGVEANVKKLLSGLTWMLYTAGEGENTYTDADGNTQHRPVVVLENGTYVVDHTDSDYSASDTLTVDFDDVKSASYSFALQPGAAMVLPFKVFMNSNANSAYEVVTGVSKEFTGDDNNLLDLASNSITYELKFNIKNCNVQDDDTLIANLITDEAVDEILQSDEIKALIELLQKVDNASEDVVDKYVEYYVGNGDGTGPSATEAMEDSGNKRILDESKSEVIDAAEEMAKEDLDKDSVTQEEIKDELDLIKAALQDMITNGENADEDNIEIVERFIAALESDEDSTLVGLVTNEDGSKKTKADYEALFTVLKTLSDADRNYLLADTTVELYYKAIKEDFNILLADREKMIQARKDIIEVCSTEDVRKTVLGNDYKTTYAGLSEDQITGKVLEKLNSSDTSSDVWAAILPTLTKIVPNWASEFNQACSKSSFAIVRGFGKLIDFIWGGSSKEKVNYDSVDLATIQLDADDDMYTRIMELCSVYYTNWASEWKAEQPTNDEMLEHQTEITNIVANVHRLLGHIDKEDPTPQELAAIYKKEYDNVVKLTKLIKNAETNDVAQFKEVFNETEYKKVFGVDNFEMFPNVFGWTKKNVDVYKGDIITLDALDDNDQTFRVLSIDNNVATVMTMFNVAYSTFGSNSTYEGSNLDDTASGYAMVTLVGLPTDAVVQSNIKQDTYTLVDVDDYDGNTRANHALASSKTYSGNQLSKKAYAVGIEDIDNYFDGKYNNNDLKEFFDISSNGIWLRSKDVNDDVFIYRPDLGYIGSCASKVYTKDQCQTRLIFKVDLSKTNFVNTSRKLVNADQAAQQGVNGGCFIGQDGNEICPEQAAQQGASQE